MRRRGQLVLAAAALVAVALIPVVAAYLQMGYVPQDQEPSAARPGVHADRLLTRAVERARPGIPQSYAWTNRESAVSAVEDALAPRLDALRTSRLGDGTAYVVEYAPRVADVWESANCPGGPNRRFGACEALGGVVVQDRNGRAHVVAVAFQVRVVSADSAATLVLVVER